MIPSSALDDLRRQNPVPEVAGKWVSLRSIGGRAGRYVGPCPLCSDNHASKTATRFECEAEKFVCAVCCKAGDVIALVMEREGKDFRGAVEWLGGAVDEADPEEEARRAAERAEKKRREEEVSEQFRERERRRLFGEWRAARPIVGTAVEDYLALRGLKVPPGARLRCAPAFPYFIANGKGGFRQIHCGPAMLAAFVRSDGHFTGLHITWIDLSQPKGKVALHDLETGELLPAKKMRGSKQGGHIELLRCDAARQLFTGEGIESVLAVYTAMVERGRPLEEVAFWAAGDLGNLAGRATGRVPHPTQRQRNGRPAQVPGPVPDMSSPAISIPFGVSDLRLLADGDSDPFTTRLAMQRAEARHASPARRITTAWPAEGADFNKVLKPEVA